MDRSVNVKDLVSRKINRKGKRLDELIQLQRSADKEKADFKLKGLQQIGAEFFANLVLKNANGWNQIWRSIRSLDLDKNGFLSIEELENCFRDIFPVEYEGKSAVHYFRKYGTDHD